MSALSHKLFSVVLILSAISLNDIRGIEISTYARVSKNGDSISHNKDDRSEGNDRRFSNMTHGAESTLIDKQNTTLRQQKSITSHESTVEAAREERSEGRAIKSNYYLPLSNFLTKAQQSNSYRNEKEGRLIVYPSYTQNIDQTRRRYDMVPSPSTGFGQVAQKRFSPSEAYAGTLYKIKHPEKFQGYQYPTPTNAPPPPPPVMMMLTKPPPPPPTSAPPPPPPPSPPRAQYLPPSKFSQPIVVADYETEDSPTPPPKPDSSPFIPTIIPQDIIDDDNDDVNSSSMNPIIDLLSFDKQVNTSFMPPELHAIKDSIESNHVMSANDNNDDTDTGNDAALSPADSHKFSPNTNSASSEGVNNGATLFDSKLQKFPPNVDSAYMTRPMVLSPEIIDSYLPPPSGETEAAKSNKTKSVSAIDLHKFPPNIDSGYLPPEMMKYHELVNSYLPPPSGLSEAEKPASGENAGVASIDLHKFPPNIDSGYLPPEMMKYLTLINSYLPPPSGEVDAKSNNAAVPQTDNNIDDNNSMMYLPPKDLHNFPPNINSFYLPPEMMREHALINSYLPPPSGDPDQSLAPPVPRFPPPPSVHSPSPPLPPRPAVSSLNQQLAANAGGMQMSGPYIYRKPPGGMMDMTAPMPNQPPSMMDMTAPSGPMLDHDHDHHHHHDHDHYGPSGPWDSYDYFDHHHHHHVEETTTTTEAPAPEEPRVKKYSYYYLGRKLWYIPLYFTLWFCLYVAALIIRSIGRHKVDLPNHYVARSLNLHDMSHRELVEKINKMTAFTMAQIEDFKDKYL